MAKMATSRSPLSSGIPELRCRRVNDLEFDPRMRLQAADQIEKIAWRNRAHEAEPKLGLFDQEKGPRLMPGALDAAVHLLEIRPYHAAELGEMGVRPLAMG